MTDSHDQRHSSVDTLGDLRSADTKCRCCGNTFPPNKKGHIKYFCSLRCKNRCLSLEYYYRNREPSTKKCCMNEVAYDRSSQIEKLRQEISRCEREITRKNYDFAILLPKDREKVKSKMEELTMQIDELRGEKKAYENVLKMLNVQGKVSE